MRASPDGSGGGEREDRGNIFSGQRSEELLAATTIQCELAEAAGENDELVHGSVQDCLTDVLDLFSVQCM